jgi:hypothetical protein
MFICIYIIILGIYKIYGMIDKEFREILGIRKEMKETELKKTSI